MNYRIFLWFLLTFFFSCAKDNGGLSPHDSQFPCANSTLDIKSDGKSCDKEPKFLICGYHSAEDVSFVEISSMDWIPEICYSVGETIEYQSETQVTSAIVLDEGHYIQEERLSAPCDKSMEHGHFICQKNEVKYIDLQIQEFGLDTIRFEFRTSVRSIVNNGIGPKSDLVRIYQRRSKSNIVNWLFQMDAAKDDPLTSEINAFSAFHKRISLQGKEFEDVHERILRVNYHAKPYGRVYFKRGIGLLGFELNDQLWLKS